MTGEEVDGHFDALGIGGVMGNQPLWRSQPPLRLFEWKPFGFFFGPVGSVGFTEATMDADGFLCPALESPKASRSFAKGLE